MKGRNSKRVLSWLLALVMVSSLIPTAAFAAGEPAAQKTIVDFLDMPASAMELYLGAAPEIPDVLNAKVEDQEDAEEVPVTWTSEPEFDKDTEGEYVFTSALVDQDAYTLAPDVVMPSVTVTVAAEQENETPAPLVAEDNLLATDSTNISGTIDSNATWADGSAIDSTDGVTITGSEKADSPVTITVEGNVTVNGTITVQSGYVKFEGGGTLKRGDTFGQNDSGNPSGPAHLFVVQDGATVTVTNLTVDGNKNKVKSASTTADSGGRDTRSLFSVEAGGTLSLGEGAILQNNHGGAVGNGTVSAGAVVVATGGTLEMKSDATVKNCVTVDSSAIMIGDSSGKLNDTHAIFRMTGGTIEENVNSKGMGGVLLSIAVFEMTGGTICNNSAANGGGVYINGGTMKISGDAVISRNTATQNGGGLYLNQAGGRTTTLTMDGGTISGNKAVRGGGVYVAGGTVNLNAGTIEKNQGANNTSNVFGGGGITVMGGTVAIGNGTLTDSQPDLLIQENKAYDGAGIMVGDGTTTGAGAVTIHSDAKISGNTGTFGAGVYAAKGTVTIDGATITGNLGAGLSNVAAGAGLMVLGENATVTLKGNVNITGNKQGADILEIGTYPEDNVQLNAEKSVLHLDAALGETASVGLHTQNLTGHSTQTLVTATDEKIAAASVGRFFDDAGTHAISLSSNDKKILVWGGSLGTLADVYVASGTHEPAGKDDNAGSATAPVLTLGKAYELVKTGGTIHVMSDLTTAAPIKMDAGKAVKILSDDGDANTPNDSFSILRDTNYNDTLLSISGGTVTLQNITVDGQKIDAKASTALVVVSSGAKAVLDSGVTLTGYYKSGNSDSRGAIFVTGNDSLVTMKDGALITGNSSGYGGGVMVDNNSDNVTTARFLMEGGTITGNTSNSTLTDKGYGGAGVYVWGGTFEMTGGAITENTSAGNGGGIEVYTGAAKLTGGEISENTAQRGGGVLLDSGTLTIGGTIKVDNNKDNDKNPQNVYLASGQVVSIDSQSHLEGDATIGVFTAVAPAPGADIKIATGANSDDLKQFVSDNAAFAGIVWCNGQTDTASTTHIDTPITAAGHKPGANTLWLSVDARIQADISVGLGENGKLILEAHGLDPKKVYTVLDKDGNAVKTDGLTLETGTAADKGWSKPTANGDLVFSGLDPANAPYQVVTNDTDSAEPNGNAEKTTEAKVGGRIMALYVAGAAGGTEDKAWAAGSDENGDGTRAKPFLTLNHAYGVLDEEFAQAGIITVLSSIEQGASMTFKSTTGAIILGEGENITVKRTVGDDSSAGLFDVNGCAVTFSNLTFDGNKDYTSDSSTYPCRDANGAFSVRSGGKLTLKGCAVKDFSVQGNANSNWDKSLINGGQNQENEIVLDKVTIENNVCTKGYSTWNLITGGALTIKNSTIQNNTFQQTAFAVNTFSSAKLEGKVIISGNTNTAGAADVYLATGTTLELVGNLADGSSVGVYTATLPVKAGDEVPVTSNGTAADAAKFFSDRATRAGVEYNDTQVVLTINGRSESLAVAEQTVIVSNTDPDLWYSLDNGATWKKGNGGKLDFTGLDKGKEYTVISRDSDTPSGTTGAKTVGKVVTPNNKADVGGADKPFVDVKAPDVKREHSATPDKDKITILPGKGQSGQEYAVINKATGEILNSKWLPGSGDLVFDELDPNGVYEVVTRVIDVDGNTPGNQPSGQGQGVVSAPLTDPDSVGGGYDAESGKASITVDPTDPDLDYIVIDPATGKPANGVAWQPGDGGEIKFDGLEPGTDYIIATRPHGDANITGNGDASGLPVVTPPTPVTAPAKDGGYQTTGGADNEVKREANQNATDKITIKGEADYSYAVRVKNDDGSYTYYKKSGGANTPDDAIPVWADGAGDHVFDGLPFGQDYEIVKVKTADKNDASKVAIPAVTPITTLPPTVDENDVTTAIQGNGKASITVNPASSDYKYVLTDDKGNVVAVKPGNDGSITFPDLIPGKEYKVQTVPKSDTDPTGKIDTTRATDVTTPVTDPDNVTAEIKDGKVTITVDPAAENTKYAVVDASGKVVDVTGENWKTAEDGKVVFEGLTPDTDYEVVAVPAGTSPIDSGWSGKGTPIHTPAATVTAPTANQVTKTSSTITINPATAGLEYNLADKDGNIVKTWTPGKGGSITFTGLAPNTQYTVLVRDPNSGEPSVPVKGPTVTTSSGGSSGSGGSSSGGGSSSSTSPKVESAKNGKVSVSPKNPGKGDKVIITCKPDSGYEVGSVTVTDKNGNTIRVTDEGNGKYSYIQPASSAQPVTVKVSFKKAADLAPVYDNCPKDETCPIARFTDASTTAWYHDGVHYCVDEGLMSGTSSTTFSPDTATTRGMIVTILYRLEGEPGTSNTSYPDVAAGQYYTEAVAWASANGIVTGYTNGNFGPNDPITREQMAAILYRYAGYRGCDVSQRADLGRFSDSASISGYAVEALSWANAEGLITGTSATTLTPNGQATRAQVATILMRFCENIAEK